MLKNPSTTPKRKHPFDEGRFVAASAFALALALALFWAPEVPAGSPAVDPMDGATLSDGDRVVARLEALLAAGEAEGAADLARRAEPEHAGVPRFDFTAGMALARAGYPGEAAVYFERVVLVQPGSRRARLELARARYAAGDYEGAERQFAEVLRAEPPPDVAARIEQYLAAIERRTAERRRHSEGWVGLGVGYDTNVQGADDSEDMVIGGVAFRLDQDQDSDVFFTVETGYRHLRPVTTRRAWELEVRGDYRDNADVDGYDLLTAGLSGGPTWRRGERRIRGRVEVRETRLDGEGFRRTVALAPAVDWTLDGARRQFGGRLYRSDYPRVEGREVLGAGVSGSWARPLGKARRTVFGGANLAVERATDSDYDYYSRDMAGLFGGMAWLPERRTTVSLHGAWQYERYREEAPLSAFWGGLSDDFDDGAERAHTLRIGARYAHAVGGGWRVSAEVSGTEKRSNVTLREYDRMEAKAGVRYDW